MKRRRQTASKQFAQISPAVRWADSSSSTLPWPSVIACRKHEKWLARQAAKAEKKRLAAEAKALLPPKPKVKQRHYYDIHNRPRSKVKAADLELARATNAVRKYRYLLKKDPTNARNIANLQRCNERVERERHNRAMIAEAKIRAAEYKLKQEHRSLRKPITGAYVDFIAEANSTNNAGLMPISRS